MRDLVKCYQINVLVWAWATTFHVLSTSEHCEKNGSSRRKGCLPTLCPFQCLSVERVKHEDKREMLRYGEKGKKRKAKAPQGTRLQAQSRGSTMKRKKRADRFHIRDK